MELIETRIDFSLLLVFVRVNFRNYQIFRVELIHAGIMQSQNLTDRCLNLLSGVSPFSYRYLYIDKKPRL